MQITHCYCDACHEIIRDGEKKYFLVCFPFEQYGKNNYKTAYAKLLEGKAKAKCSHFEICYQCKDILEYLFLMRKAERTKVIKQLHKMAQEKRKENTNGKKEKN